MPPQKPKLHYKTGKLKTIKPPSMNGIPPSIPSSSSAGADSVPSTSTTNRDSDADRQFELELTWCVQQLESSLSSGKLNQKQAQDTEKTIKILKSKNQPIIKKRQLMRSTFGDYRAKMAEEEKKMSLGARQIKFDNKAVPNKKSYFVKKSALLTSGKDFKFNFPVDEIGQLNISENPTATTAENGDTDKEKISDNSSSKALNFHFIPSGNTFKFNFDIKEEKS